MLVLFDGNLVDNAVSYSTENLQVQSRWNLESAFNFPTVSNTQNLRHAFLSEMYSFVSA